VTISSSSNISLLNNAVLHKTWGCHDGVAEDECFLGCDAASLGKEVPMT